MHCWLKTLTLDRPTNLIYRKEPTVLTRLCTDIIKYTVGVDAVTDLREEVGLNLNLPNQITDMTLKSKMNRAHVDWWIVVADKFVNLRYVRYPQPFATEAAARRMMKKIKRAAPAWRYGVWNDFMLPNVES
jgi:hypothetical protein